MALERENKSKREHDTIVKELKEMLESKGIKCLPFHRNSAEVMRKGFTINPKTQVTAFIPDIIIQASEAKDDLIVVEYVNSKRQLTYDVRGLMLLSQMRYSKDLNLILNDDILQQDVGIPEGANIQQVSLTTFKKFLRTMPKEHFLGFLKG